VLEVILQCTFYIGVSMTEYTAKSVVLDIADNWGDASYTGIRAIEFYLASSLISIADADITCYGYTHSASYYPKYAFITGLSYDGDMTATCWLKNNVTAGRIICVFDTAITFDEIRYHNHTQPSTYYTSRGVKNVVVTVSDDAITDTTYEAAISNSTEISDEQWVQHASAAGGDEQVLPLVGDVEFSPDINDTVSITESIGVLVYPMVDINISTVVDSVTVAESITVEFTELFIDDVYEAVNVVENINGTTVTFFGTDPRPEYYPKVPTASCVASFREEIEITGKAPITTGTAYFGSTVKGEAPVVSAALTLKGLFFGYLSVAGKAPTVKGTGLFGSTVSGKTPTVSCTSTLVSRGITISGYAPVPTAEIVIPNYSISVEGYSPFPSVEAELNSANTITVTGKAPASFGNMILIEGITIAVIGTSPIAKATYNTILLGGSFISITGTVPVATMYQPSGIEDPGSISLSENSRLGDITLQYSRWPDAI